MDIREFLINGIAVQAVLDSIDNAQMEAIVCPGNSKGLMRGGASQAIRLKWGDYIEFEAKKKSPIHIGKAVNINIKNKSSTKGIIYTAAIVNPVDTATEKAVFAASKAAILCALKNNYHSVAFPIIGAGTGQVDFSLACKAILDGIFSQKWHSSQLSTIGIYVRRDFKYEILKEVLNEFTSLVEA